MASNNLVKAPEMNEGRENHGSVCLGEYVYVFGGQENAGAVESLHVKHGKAWYIISRPTQMMHRGGIAVAIIEEHLIAVYGGFTELTELNDGYMFDTNRNTFEPILGDNKDFRSWCVSPA